MQGIDLLAVITREGHWRPGIGDPTAMGWLIVGSYVFSLVLCSGCWLSRSRVNEDACSVRYARFWMMMSVLFAMLAINKQLDLQSWLTLVGRGIAREQGWFDERRLVQRWFIAGVGVLAAMLLAWVLWQVRGLGWRVGLAAVGAAVTMGFVVMRAASFHGMDDLLRSSLIGPLKMNHAMELAGIILVGAGAWLSLISLQSPLNRRESAAGLTD